VGKVKNENMIPVEDAEQVARAIFSPSFLDPDGHIGPQAFYMEILPSGDAETDISVFRLGQCEDISEVVRNMNARKPGDKVCGYGEMNVGEIKHVQISLPDSKINVLASPSKRNSAHASIVIEMDGASITACNFYEPNGQPLEAINVNLMYIMTQLAEISELVPLDTADKEDDV
jgi:hypothetical protein